MNSRYTGSWEIGRLVTNLPVTIFPVYQHLDNFPQVRIIPDRLVSLLFGLRG
jgi:hypothetical protein